MENGLGIHRNRLVERFFELVQTDSESGRERAICDQLIRLFSSLHSCTSVTEDDAAARTGHGAGNLFVEVSPSAGCEHWPKLLFTCHMDTVAPGRSIHPVLAEDGYLRSGGDTILAADDKAGIAALLEALTVLEEKRISHGGLQLVITVGEESGLVGAKAIDGQMLSADFGFALDSNGSVGEIVVAGPTQAKIHAMIHGKAAHAGVNPEAGISAIQVAGKAIGKMPLGRIDHETTANIGKFVGGGETNIVCDRVELFAEARSHVQLKLDQQLQRMQAALEETAAEFGASVTFTAEIVYPAFSYEQQHPVVQLAQRAVTVIGRESKLVKSGGGSDANIFNGLGVPTLNLAIGYEHIHTTSEQLHVEELTKTAELVLALIKEAGR